MTAWIIFAVSGLVVVLAGIRLTRSGETIAEVTGLGGAWVGAVFIAIATSLPELAVSLAAIRMGAIDMAVGNILGSNLFNILILSVDDAFYRGGLLLADASGSHLLTVFATIAMSGVAIVGLTIPSAGKRFLLAGDAALMLLIYGGNATMLYLLQR